MKLNAFLRKFTKRAVRKVSQLGILALAAFALAAHAQEAQIRKNLNERMGSRATINEINKTPINGLFEVRVNDSDIFYTDAGGNYIVQGELLDLKNKVNLTQERIDKLTAVNFSELPIKDAFVQVRGNGKRKLAVFEDPNCAFCKRFEAGLQKVDNVTVYFFLYPILGEDSVVKSNRIWCADDKLATWQNWMLKNTAPTGAASCDTGAVRRNVALGKKLRVTGTPTLIFANGSRVPGAIDAEKIENIFSSINQ